MEMMAYKRCLMDFNHHLEEKNMEMGQEHPRCLLPSGVEPKLISFQFPNEFRRQLEIWWLRELRHQREFVHCELEFGSCSTQSWVAGWWMSSEIIRYYGYMIYAWNIDLHVLHLPLPNDMTWYDKKWHDENSKKWFKQSEPAIDQSFYVVYLDIYWCLLTHLRYNVAMENHIV
jgi:hypothetical protein